jgi:hypothetical protein
MLVPSQEVEDPLRIHVSSLLLLRHQLRDSNAAVRNILRLAQPYGDADAAADAVGVIEVNLDDLRDDKLERDLETYDDETPTALESKIQSRLDAIRARVEKARAGLASGDAGAASREPESDDKWPCPFMVLRGLAVTGAELSSARGLANAPTARGGSEKHHEGSDSRFVERFPDMWHALGYPKIILVVHKTRETLSAPGREWLNALYL